MDERDLVPANELLEPPYDGNVARLLDRSVERNPETIAIEHDGETVTYREFAALVERYARGLRAFGLEAGDRACVYIPNSIDYCAVIWACCRSGIVASPLNPAYRRREIAYQVDHADATALIVAGDPDDHVVEAVADLEAEILRTTDGGSDDGAHASLPALARTDDAPAETLCEREDDDVMCQPYTSGTTGNPKGVLLTHRNFRVQIANSVSSYSASPIQGDGLIILPMYHITGLLQMLSSLSAGRTLHLLRPDQWDPERVLELLADHDVPAFVGVATMFSDLLEAYDSDEYDLEFLRRAGQGGDKLPRPVQREFEETFGVSLSEGYGLTETTATTHTVRWSTLGNRPGSVGQPVGHARSKIVDENGEEVGVGEDGEILIGGPQVMAGYYEDPEANEAAFTEDGFFRTGDIGSRDADNYYYVEGREKEMILTAGYNVYPREIEATLYDHPDVLEAAVFGVPDERRGETVAAAVATREGSTLTEADVEAYVLGELAPYKHPRYVEIREELPKTGSGKIRKTVLQAEFDEAYGDD
ncbi:class I adenylate-forming enzyme family protein [Natronolimnohabitans innermongolicus]|uniref:AMP-dependent synthetase and ligase n=1 Tax=Natronolimnohabitans innermongolicus JCM 12255 TaxID=1227499 RepID=L9WLX0_9EURY|nr:class I adenylate-forming enzyme family protein [Natronolimnohabitans innermongolicus]ELY49343.1 AMP-dependent synthetase and ligase [Natronolimnohabitans innermongolicus JCM 12255]